MVHIWQERPMHSQAAPRNSFDQCGTTLNLKAGLHALHQWLRALQHEIAFRREVRPAVGTYVAHESIVRRTALSAPRIVHLLQDKFRTTSATFPAEVSKHLVPPMKFALANLPSNFTVRLPPMCLARRVPRSWCSPHRERNILPASSVPASRVSPGLPST